jgi:hypothetical protein
MESGYGASRFHEELGIDVMEYKFKQIKLSKAEKLWLTEILKLDFTKFDVRYLRVKLWKKLPEDFDPDKIDRSLVFGNNLTLIGLWHVDPGNALFTHIPKIVEIIKDLILKNPAIKEIKANEIAVLASITERDAEIALRLLFDLGDFFGSSSGPSTDYGCKQVGFPQGDHAYDKFLKFKNLEQEMEQYFIRCASSSRVKNKRNSGNIFQQKADTSFLQSSTQNIWDDIHNEYEIKKRVFGKSINFVTSKYTRVVIFRDIEQAHILASQGFPKPAVILVGGVIEELLRQYLEYKKISPISKDFAGYIKTCEQKGLLKKGISRLSDSVRHFRNLVHLAEEKTKKHTISKATAKGAVSSIFTIANDF